MKFNNIKQNRKLKLAILLVLICLVMFLSIAYAVLSTTLTIIGNTEITAASWDIHFDNIQINSASVEATTAPNISGSKTISFGVTLEKPGDFYKYSVDIVNEGTIDAMIDSVTKTPELTPEQAKYIKYEIEYTDGNSINSKQLLLKNQKKSMSVLVSYRSDINPTDLPSTATTLNLSFTLIYTQADSTATEIPEGAEIKVVSGDINTVGSEICIGTECFYLISNSNSNIIMLAKYNLYVGGERTQTTWTEYQQPTGLQDFTMKGYVNSGVPFKGIVPFSSTNYWANSVSTYPAHIYNSNASIYQHVENYKTHLESLGVEVEEARLITLEELEQLDCSMDNQSCKPTYGWVRSMSYWTGSAISTSGILYVSTIGAFNKTVYNNLSDLGVRPVITISLTEF